MKVNNAFYFACALILAGIGCSFPPVSGNTSPSPTNNPNRLALPSIPGNVETIRISPDGKELAFSTSEGLFTTDIAGPAKKITDTNGIVRQMNWSNDSRSLAYLERDAAGGGIGSTETYQLMLMSFPNASKSILASNLVNSRFALSPEASYVAYTTSQAPLSQINLVSLQDRSVEKVFEGNSINALTWSPDGSKLAFEGRQAQDSPESPLALFITSPLEEKQKKIAGLIFNGQPFYWSSDSLALNVIDYRETLKNLSILTYALDGTEQQRKLIVIPEENGKIIYLANLIPSADGSRILAEKYLDAIHHNLLGIAAIDLSSGKLTNVSPPAKLIGWIEKDSRFLCLEGQGESRKFFIVSF